MTHIATSKDRFTFQKNLYFKRQKDKGKSIDEGYLKMWESAAEERLRLEADPAWKENNLEYDLRSTQWMLDKVKEDRYAQNLYAALCNIRWQRCDVFPILKDEFWHCSWRYAGGIIADMRQEGDYIDWYCSGIRERLSNDDIDQLSEEEKKRYVAIQEYVPESVVTDEIAHDLKLLGWQWSEWPDDDII